MTRLSDFERPLPESPRPQKRPRVRHFHLLPFVFGGILISLRRFKTSKKRRSKQYRQIILPLRLLPVKEVAIRIGRPGKRRKLSRWRRALATTAIVLLILAGIGGSVYYGVQLRKPTSIDLPNRVPAPTLAHSASAASAKTLPKSQPVRLRIDKIQLDAGVITIGRNADGTIEVPVDYHATGWYKYGPTPGELGPAVIVGHVDNVKGIAVFWRLRELVPGDTFEVDRADGKTAKFKVTDVKQVPKDNFPTQQVYGNLNYAGIRLITCGGTFNSQTHEYDLNTVVFGQLVI